MLWLKIKVQKNKHIAIGIIVLSLFCSLATAQGLYRTFISPSQLAMGGNNAFGEDSYSLSANLSVAGVNESQNANFSAGILNSQFLPELKTVYFGAYIPGKSSRDHFRLSIGRFGFSEFNIKILDLAYAREINENICISVNFASSFLKIDQHGSRMGIGLSLGFSGQVSSQTSFGVVMNLPTRKNNNVDIYSSPEIAIALRHKLSAIVQIYSGINKSYVTAFNFSGGIHYKIKDSIAILCGFSTDASSISFGVKIHKGKYQIQMGSSFAFISGAQVSVAISHPI